uniref:Uncharacterized protein n=1 Tax=Chlamydomonas chlamydogama TaxID=225041 RepID=A0A7S2VVK2_9CHLO
MESVLGSALSYVGWFLPGTKTTVTAPPLASQADQVAAAGHAKTLREPLAVAAATHAAALEGPLCNAAAAAAARTAEGMQKSAIILACSIGFVGVSILMASKR